MNICLDVGHASGTGARGCGREEHEVVAWFTPYLRDVLVELGHEVDVVDYPSLSNADDLNATIKAANGGDYDLGLSLHLDASERAEACGGHVCFYKSSVNAARLANYIAGRLCNYFPGRSNQVQARPDGALKSLAMLKKTRCVWALIEICFITNAQDMKFLLGAPEVVARAIALGVQDYVEYYGLNNK